MSGRLSVVFASPRRVEVREEPIPRPGAGVVLVAAECSAVSAGTELLVYRGEAPPDGTADPALPGSLRFPLKFGYSMVGRVVEAGAGVAPEWVGRRVFAFHPHESHFLAETSRLHAVPEGRSPPPSPPSFPTWRPR